MTEFEEIKNTIVVVHPCVTDPSKVTVEGNLAKGLELEKDYLDSEKMCELISSSPEVEDVKCSAKLGLGKFRVGSNKVTIFKNGRIVVREAGDEADAINAIIKVKKIISEAINRQ